MIFGFSVAIYCRIVATTTGCVDFRGFAQSDDMEIKGLLEIVKIKHSRIFHVVPLLATIKDCAHNWMKQQHN